MDWQTHATNHATSMISYEIQILNQHTSGFDYA